MSIDQIVRVTERLNAETVALRARSNPYDAGYDCALNGANDKNCHFGWFSSPSFTAEWERGKRDGERDLARRTGGEK